MVNSAGRGKQSHCGRRSPIPSALIASLSAFFVAASPRHSATDRGGAFLFFHFGYKVPNVLDGTKPLAANSMTFQSLVETSFERAGARDRGQQINRTFSLALYSFQPYLGGDADPDLYRFGQRVVYGVNPLRVNTNHAAFPKTSSGVRSIAFAMSRRAFALFPVGT